MIPFNQPGTVGNERLYVEQAIHGRHLSGDGPFTKRCHDLLQRRLGVPAALLTTSCTHALEMAALLLDIEPGDEVIVPSFTFASTANAFVLRGARPVFVDSRPDTLNIDERQIEELITDRTRAIVVVHYAGIGCAMDEILQIGRTHGLSVVEDNAHGLFGKYRGRWLGTLGTFATQSFHSSKNFSCGEGGALFVNDARFVQRAEILREKGTDRSRFLRGEVDKYTWRDMGSSYLPSDLLAAFLLAQLENETAIQFGRRRIHEMYDRALAGWAEQHGIGRPHCPADREQSWHMYYLMLPTLDSRSSLAAHLRSRGITAAFHYQPLHLSDMGMRFATKSRDLPVAEAAGDRLLRLPLYNDMQEDAVAAVIDALCAWP